MDHGYDFLVVGAGSSGCAVAYRLAEAGAEVALVEAGEEIEESEIPNALDCDLTGRFDWNFHAVNNAGRVSPVPRGRAVGGSSIINTCIALRPDPSIFEQWSKVVPGWQWNEVLPFFRSVETDVDFHGHPWHGSNGPVPIVRWSKAELEELSRKFLNGSTSLGYSFNPDLNDPRRDCVGLVPMNRISVHRASSNRCYLRSRPKSLEVISGTTVDRLLVSQRGRIDGLLARTQREEKRLTAANTVLCAGSYATPAILMRSGIGPERLLRHLGIPINVSLPGVGCGLHDHSQVHLYAPVDNCRRDIPAVQVIAKSTSGIGDQENDLQLLALNSVAIDQFDVRRKRLQGNFGMACSLVMYSESRGMVSISSRDPFAAPVVKIDHIETEQDLERHIVGLRKLVAVCAAGGIELRESDGVVRGDVAELRRLISDRVQSCHHPMGTARMASPDDNLGVVDSEMRVRDITNLYIADLSIVPVNLNANTHLSACMLGEKAASLLME